MDCNQNGDNSLCCFDQKCVKSDVCIIHYYVPPICGFVFSIIIGFGISLLIKRCLAKQAEKIKKELREKQRRDNIRRQKMEMKKLLGKEGYNQYRQEHPEAFQEKNGPQQQIKDEEDDLDKFLQTPNLPQKQNTAITPQQQQEQHYNFVRQHMMQNQEFLKLVPQQQHAMILAVMQQQMQQQMLMAQQQNQNFSQMQQQVQQQKKQAPKTDAINNSQTLQPKKNQQIIQQSQQIRASQQSQQNNTPLRASQNQNDVSPVRIGDSQEGPKFFGKQNPNQAIIEAQNPLYPEYKPNVPNAGKIEENLIKNASVDQDLSKKRSILNNNRSAMSKHLSQKVREGNLPSEIKRI